MKNGGEYTAIRIAHSQFMFYSTSKLKCSTAGGTAK